MSLKDEGILYFIVRPIRQEERRRARGRSWAEHKQSKMLRIYIENTTGVSSYKS
jgi:hypothetical protein